MSAEELSRDDKVKSTATKSKVPHSCTKAFDSLYFCYSPFHQARQYYKNGELDDCRGRLRRFWLCLMSRLTNHAESERLFAQEEQRERQARDMDNVEHVWKFREEYLENLARAEEQDDNEPQMPHEKERWWL